MSNYEERLILLSPNNRVREIAIERLWAEASAERAWAGSVGNSTDALGWTTGNDIKWPFDSGQNAWQILAVLVLCAEGEIE